MNMLVPMIRGSDASSVRLSVRLERRTASFGALLHGKFRDRLEDACLRVDYGPRPNPNPLGQETETPKAVLGGARDTEPRGDILLPNEGRFGLWEHCRYGLHGDPLRS